MGCGVERLNRNAATATQFKMEMGPGGLPTHADTAYRLASLYGVARLDIRGFQVGVKGLKLVGVSQHHGEAITTNGFNQNNGSGKAGPHVCASGCGEIEARMHSPGPAGFRKPPTPWIHLLGRSAQGIQQRRNGLCTWNRFDVPPRPIARRAR